MSRQVKSGAVKKNLRPCESQKISRRDAETLREVKSFTPSCQAAKSKISAPVCRQIDLPAGKGRPPRLRVFARNKKSPQDPLIKCGYLVKNAEFQIIEMIMMNTVNEYFAILRPGQKSRVYDSVN